MTLPTRPMLPGPSIATRLFPADGGSADHDQDLDRFNRPIRNQWVKDVHATNKPVFIEFEPAYGRGGSVMGVEDPIRGRFDRPRCAFAPVCNSPPVSAGRCRSSVPTARLPPSRR